MTVTTQDISVNYVGDDVVTVFPFAFHTDAVGDIKVFEDGIEIFTGFVVTLNSDQSSNPGGNVEYGVAPASGVVIVIRRDTERTQDVDYNKYDPFPAETHERALDKLTLISQELSRGVEVDRLSAGVLYGNCDPFDLGAAGSPLVNYTQSLAIGDIGSTEIDAVAGTITIPISTVWTVDALLIAVQNSNDRNESMFLELGVNGVWQILSVFDVTSFQTDYRGFNAVITKVFSQGDVIQLRCRATGDMGTITPESVNFEVSRKV